MASILKLLLKNKRKKEFKGGSLSKIYLCDDYIIKSYKGKDPRGIEKLKKEAIYLENLPKELRHYFPKILEKLNDKNSFSLLLSYHTIPSITDQLLDKKINKIQIWKDIEKVTLFMKENLYTQKKTTLKKNYLKKAYFNRLNSALKILEKDEYYKDILKSNTFLNGDELTNIYSLIELLKKDKKLVNLMNPKYLTLFHGNFHTANILADKNEFILIDPRGETIGSVDYDESKMICHLITRYDEVHEDYFSLNKSKNKISIELTKESIGRRYAYLQDKYIDKIPKNKLRKLLLLAGFHAISFSSYHARKEKPNKKRVLYYYLAGLKLINDIVLGKQIKTNKSLFPYIK
jgi:hypothetical protein